MGSEAENVSSSAKGGLGCLSPLILLIAFPGLISWISSLVVNSLVTQLFLFVVVIASMITIAWVLGHSSAKALKVLAIFFLWTAMTLSFAVAYAGMYRWSPGQFRAANDILDESTRSDIKRLGTHLRTLLLRGHQISLMESASEEVYKALSAPAFDRATVRGVAKVRWAEERLTHDVIFEISDVQGSTWVGQEQQPYREAGIGLKTAKERLWWIELNLPGLPQSDPEQRFAKELMAAQNPQGVRNSCNRYRSYLGHQETKTEATIRNLIGGVQALDISNFVLLSTSISTTIGSADVSPNSKTTRYLIVLQSFLSVFIFGYAVQVLWS